MSEERGLPFSVAAERFVLGSVLMDDSCLAEAGVLKPEEFSLEKHRKIWARVLEIRERGERPDALTVFAELERRGESESTDGLSYLISLDDGLPRVPSIEGYIRVVQDKAALRNIIFASQNMMNQAMLGNATPDEILEMGRETVLRFLQDRAKSSLETPGTIVGDAGGIVAYLDRRDRQEGVKTGFSGFDVMASGLKPGKLYVIGARPRMGKSAFVLNVAEHVSIKNDGTTLIFSLEMDKQSLVDRMICSRARVNTKKFEGGYLSNEESRKISSAAGEVCASEHLYIDDRATTNMQEIHAKVRKHAVNQPVSLVVIDYLQLLINGNEKYRVGEMSKISRDAKLLAKDCKVPVLALSQLSRDCDTRTDHHPQLSDLRESGSIEQDADLVGFLYRPEVYDPDREDLRGVAELIVAKQRSGPEGKIPLVWMKEIVRFEMAAEEYRQED